jgi:peptide/nickel transport system permease protein
MGGLASGWPTPYQWAALHPAHPQPNAHGCYTLLDGQVRCLPSGQPAQVVGVAFPLGTDTLGRCVLSRLLVGGRVSLLVGLLAVGITLGVGLALGLVAGYWRGRVDAAIQWLMAVVWSVPTLLLALAIAFALGRGLGTLALAIGLTTWVDLARVVRGQVLALRQREFITAARAMGFGGLRIMLRHLLPSLWGPVLVVAVANFGAAVLLEAGLSFLGLGVAAPSPSWGGMVYEGYQYLALSSGQWLALLPGGAIALTLLALNLFGVALRDALDPRAVG